jgi:serine/threonine protein kinase
MSKKQLEQSQVTNTTAALSSDGKTQTTKRKVENPDRKITDYHLLRVIGTGTFGKVYLATLGREVVALKALKKTQLIELKQVDHIKMEKSILSEVRHPFIVNL